MDRNKKTIDKILKDVLIVSLLMLPLIMLSACKRAEDETGSNGEEDILTNQGLIVEDGAEQSKDMDEEYNICVYVVGEVKSPGVCMLNKDARVYEAVEASGGFTEYAAREYVNLAKKLTDGEKIIIYSTSQVINGEIDNMDSDGKDIDSHKEDLVNINTADVNELMTLPGIGESRANDIIKYREKNGCFEAIEDIMKVSGIKQAAFSKIEDLITVN